MAGVVWVTGLYAAGKTTTAREICHRLQPEHAVVHLDGDDLRRLFGDNHDFSRSGRIALGKQYFDLAHHLESQGLLVVVSAIALFREVNEYAETTVDRLVTILLDLPISVLRERDPRGLYRAFDDGRMTSVAGLDLAVDWPQAPNLRISSPEATPAEVALHAVDTIRVAGLIS
jgi:adenylylsulfate kinase